MATSSGPILSKVLRSIDVLIEAAAPFEGLFPSILDRRAHKIPDELPQKIDGQRNEDRSYPGCNLMHDQVLLRAMYQMVPQSQMVYREAADRYIKRFATHCADTPTGLFPWGEHAFWDIANDRIGNSFPLAYDWWKEPAIHDHLSAASFWLWEKLWQFSPKCVERFAEGLDYHWHEGEPPEYGRHANIETHVKMPREERSCDFPRHGGFYIMDWAFAYLKTGRRDFREQVVRMLDYWWPHRSETGMLPLELRTPERIDVIHNKTAPGQANSLAISLFETADLLNDAEPDLASVMRERATVYAGSFLELPHDLESGVYVTCTEWDTGEIVSTARAWGSVYGTGTAAGVGTVATAFHRITGDERYYRLAESVGRHYLNESLPEGATVPAADLGAVIALMADLYEVTGERKWLDSGLDTAGKLMEVYLDEDLPRGAAGISYYDSQMGTGQLLHALARIGLLAEGRDNCALKADYSRR